MSSSISFKIYLLLFAFTFFLSLLTPTTPTTHACHAINSSGQTPSGFASPVSYFTNQQMIKGDCNGQSIDATVGNNSPLTYVYNTSYQWTGEGWEEVPLEGDNPQGAWYPEVATGEYTTTNDPSWYVAYTCEWVNNSWKCGCTSTACSSNNWQIQAFVPPAPPAPSTPSGGEGSGGGLDYDGEVPEAVKELCPGAVLIEESETMFWEDTEKDFSKWGGHVGRSGALKRSSIKESGDIRYLQIDIRKGVEQLHWTNTQRRWANTPMRCIVIESDVYFSPNYDGRATAPQQTGQKSMPTIKGGLTEDLFGSCGYIKTSNINNYSAPGLNECYTASSDWSSSLRPLLYSYFTNRAKFGVKFQSSTQRLFGKTFTTKVKITPGEWHRMAVGLKLNDDRKDNGKGTMWLDGEKVIDTGNKIMWAYEPSKDRGIKAYSLRHGYGGTPAKLIPTKDMYERYRNLRVWGVRQ